MTFFGQWDISKCDAKWRLAKRLHTRACPNPEHGHGFPHRTHFGGVQTNMRRIHGEEWEPWLVAPLSIHSPARTGQSWGWTFLVGYPSILPPSHEQRSYKTEWRAWPKLKNHEQINNCVCFKSLCLGSCVTQEQITEPGNQRSWHSICILLWEFTEEGLLLLE